MEGIANQISIGVESVWGTAVTPTASVPVKPSDGLQVENNLTGVEAIDTTPAKNKSLFLGKRNFSGSYELDLYPRIAGYFLKAALGADNVTEPEEDVVFKHTFTEAVDKPSLTVEQKIGDIIKRFAGFVPSGFNISCKTGETVVMKVDGMAKTSADAEAAITAAYETSRPFNWADITELSIAGTDIKAKVEEFSLEYTNALDMFHGLGGLEPAAKYVQQSEVKGSMTLYVDDATAAYLDDLIAGTEQEIIIEMTGDTIGSAQANILKLTISKAAFEKVETKLDFGYNVISLDFVARRDATNGLIKAELTNLVATH